MKDIKKYPTLLRISWKISVYISDYSGLEVLTGNDGTPVFVFIKAKLGIMALSKCFSNGGLLRCRHNSYLQGIYHLCKQSLSMILSHLMIFKWAAFE